MLSAPTSPSPAALFVSQSGLPMSGLSWVKGVVQRATLSVSHTQGPVEHGAMQYRIHNAPVTSPEWKSCSFYFLLALGLHDAKTCLCFQMDFDVLFSHFPLCWEQIGYAGWDFGIVTISFLLLCVFRLLPTIRKRINL